MHCQTKLEEPLFRFLQISLKEVAACLRQSNDIFIKSLTVH